MPRSLPLLGSLPHLPKMPLEGNGRWITDADGRVFIVHGVNMINKLPPYTPSSTGFGEDDAVLLAMNGINAVRVGVIYSAVEPAPGQYDDNYLNDIKGTVEVLAGKGIMSLIDFHQDGWGTSFICEGFPDWATLTDPYPIRPIGPFPGLLTNPAVMRAWGNFWRNENGPGGVALQDRFAAAWTHAAGILKDAPGILGWELLNEPWPGDILDPKNLKYAHDALTDFTQNLVNAIRTVDQEHMIWYEPWVLFDWGVPTDIGPIANLPIKIGPIVDPAKRTGMAFHNYADISLLDGAEYKLVWHNALETGNTLLCTEFGADDEADLITKQWKSADAAMMPAIYWAYWNRTPYQIVNPLTGADIAVPPMGIVYDPSLPLDDPGNVSPDKLTALTRPYPVFIAGTPLSWSFLPDPKGGTTFTFELVYDAVVTGRNDLTEIFVPALRYPNGFEPPVITGPATLVSQDLQAVVVQNTGAGQVTVTITSAS